MKYSNKISKGYEKFEDTTEWELGYNKVLKLLGKINNKNILDYGAGTLKFSRVLRDHNAKCIAVEPSKEMLKVGNKENNKNIKIYNSGDNLDFLKSNTIDIVVINFVLCVIQKKEKIVKIINEVYRVLKKRGILVILDPNPKSIGGNFVSFISEKNKELVSGDSYKVKLKKDLKSFVNLIDYYWSLKDYKEILKNSGFKNLEIKEPMIKEKGKKRWLDETSKPPYIILKTIK